MGFNVDFLILVIRILIAVSFVECVSLNSSNVNSSPYNEDQEKCFAQRKVLFNGKCEKLKSQATCGPGEWLVLKKPTEGYDLNVMQPECQQKKCTEKNEFWWHSENKCVTKSEAMKNYCDGKDVLIDHDSFGDGYCTCYDDAGSFEDSNDCYEFYQKRPCDITEVVTFNKTSGYATCTKDLCFELNHPNLVGSRATQKTDESSVSEKKLYAPLGGSGQCYRFGPQAICDHLGEGAQFKFHPILKVPECFISTRNALSLQENSCSGCIVDKRDMTCKRDDLPEIKGSEFYAYLVKEEKRNHREHKIIKHIPTTV